jgi:hypothetical protein
MDARVKEETAYLKARGWWNNALDRMDPDERSLWSDTVMAGADPACDMGWVAMSDALIIQRARDRAEERALWREAYAAGAALIGREGWMNRTINMSDVCASFAAGAVTRYRRDCLDMDLGPKMLCPACEGLPLATNGTAVFCEACGRWSETDPKNALLRVLKILDSIRDQPLLDLRVQLEKAITGEP